MSYSNWARSKVFIFKQTDPGYEVSSEFSKDWIGYRASHDGATFTSSLFHKERTPSEVLVLFQLHLQVAQENPWYAISINLVTPALKEKAKPKKTGTVHC